jgi:pimeloyl-ACP methyl ester carboxylesterase
MTTIPALRHVCANRLIRSTREGPSSVAETKQFWMSTFRSTVLDGIRSKSTTATAFQVLECPIGSYERLSSYVLGLWRERDHMADSGGLGHWKSGSSEREYLNLYAALRQEAWTALRERGWADPPEERDVATRFGTTHVFHWAGTGTPIVLLHGAGASSLMWARLIGELVGMSTYAVDGIGEPGLSVQTRTVSDREDLVAWLDDVLDGLSVDRAHLCGSSYGGWIAINAALRSPERLATLTLLEPVLDRLRAYFWVHALAVGAALMLPTPIRCPMLRGLHMEVAADLDARFSKFARLGLMQYRRGVPRQVPVTDAELASVTTPTLLLLGDKSELHHAEALLDRARATMPNIDGELVADAGHSLPLDRAAAIAPRIRAFVATPQGTTSS